MTNAALNMALAEADRCVKCGLCLPHCPTYQLYQDENESPRGRIALAEALLKKQLPVDASAQAHIEHCLLCQRCEKVCPSQVNYTRLIDATRGQWPQNHWLSNLATHPALFNSLSYLAQSLPRLKSWPTPIRLAQALGKSQAPTSGIYPAQGTTKGRIGLFLGCVTQSNQGKALSANLTLLNALGYEVVVPRKQRCCGAIAQHQGNPQQAQQYAEKNQQAFPQDLDAIVTTASGCAAHWQRHASFDPPALDIVSFLSQSVDWSQAQFAPLEKIIALHQPCTFVNALNSEGVLAELLQQVPGLKIHHIGKAGACCGAAGSHLLYQPGQACQLRQPLLDELAASNADYLVTNNIGCAIHLAEGAHTHNIQIKTLHPVELLAQQLVLR